MDGKELRVVQCSTHTHGHERIHAHPAAFRPLSLARITIHPKNKTKQQQQQLPTTPQPILLLLLLLLLLLPSFSFFILPRRIDRRTKFLTRRSSTFSWHERPIPPPIYTLSTSPHESRSEEVRVKETEKELLLSQQRTRTDGTDGAANFLFYFQALDLCLLMSP